MGLPPTPNPFVYFVCFVGLSSFRVIPLCFWMRLRYAGCFGVFPPETGLTLEVNQRGDSLSKSPQ